jgi:hypothetical protein
MIPTVLVAGTKISLTRVGFGCARIYGKSELRMSTQLIEAALAAGIRHFDTAPSYGSGLSEAVLGAVLAGVRDVTIATKIGIRRPDSFPAGLYSGKILYRRFVRPVMSRFPRTKARLLRLVHGNGEIFAPDTVSPRRRLGREEVLRGLDESLKQLRRNRADLYLLHEPDQFELTDELKDVLATLQLNGAVGAFGLAWGCVADTGVGFGTVVQGKFSNDLPAYGLEGQTRILHGVLRHGSSGHDEGLRAGVRIRKALDTYPDAAIMFSASTPAQIRRVMKDLMQYPLHPPASYKR